MPCAEIKNRIEIEFQSHSFLIPHPLFIYSYKKGPVFSRWDSTYTTVVYFYCSKTVNVKGYRITASDKMNDWLSQEMAKGKFIENIWIMERQISNDQF